MRNLCKPLYARAKAPTKTKMTGKKTTRLMRKSAVCFEKEIKFRIEPAKEFQGSHLLPVIDVSSIMCKYKKELSVAFVK